MDQGSLFFAIATGMGITVGYHRLFSHKAYQANRIVQFLALFFGAAAFQMPALAWSSQHRDHHKYVDTERDPYNITKGFWYAHMGWMLLWKFSADIDNSKDLQKNPLVMHQQHNYLLWAIGAGFVLPTLLGALFGSAWGGLLIAGCGRIVMVYHSTFCINSVCHMFGKSTYDAESTAKDNWVTALVTFGEGYHNFHHRFPSDYRNGIRAYDYDPSKWLIRLMSKAGWAWNLNRIPQQRILKARIVGENETALIHLNTLKKWTDKEAALNLLKDRYEAVLKPLQLWEEKIQVYKNLKTQLATASQNHFKRVSLKSRIAKTRFKRAYKEWQYFVERASQLPQLAPSLQLLRA